MKNYIGRNVNKKIAKGKLTQELKFPQSAMITP